MTFSLNFRSFFVLFHALFVTICQLCFLYHFMETLHHLLRVEWIPFLNQCHRNNIEKSCFYYLFEWQLNRTSHCVFVHVSAMEIGIDGERVREIEVVNLNVPLSVSCNVYFSVVIIVSINLYWQPLVNFLLALSSVCQRREKQ